MLTPTLASLAAFVLRPNWPRGGLLVAAAAAHTGLVAAAWINPPPPTAAGWLGVDAASLLFLSITSVLFLAASVYAVGYLAGEVRPGMHHNDEEELPFENFPRRCSPAAC